MILYYFFLKHPQQNLLFIFFLKVNVTGVTLLFENSITFFNVF